MLREMNVPELVLTDHIIIHFLEIEKFLKTGGFSNSLEKWMAYFKYEGKDEQIMQLIIKDDPLPERAHQNYVQFTQNDELVEIYEGRMKWQSDYKSGMLAAEEKGIQKGKLKAARRMLADDLTVDLIVKYTGLSVQEIDELKTELEMGKGEV